MSTEAAGVGPPRIVRVVRRQALARQSILQWQALLSPCGVTFIELLMSLVLVLIVGAALLVIFIAGQTSYLSMDAAVQVQQEERRAFDNAVRELREAGNVTVSGANPPQLNFQIARGYNLFATDPACPQNATCWGSDVAANEWVHYAIITTTAQTNNQQLIRCHDGAAGTTITVLNAASCRVLANDIQYIAGSSAAPFGYDPVNKLVTVTLRTQYANTALPTGATAGPVLSSQVKLRN